MTGAAISVRALEKSFGEVHALAGVDLEVEEGTVLGLLGPNGAGKTTCVRILTTLMEPDAGSATVAGLDVVRDAEVLRSRIGLAGQSAAVDENLTGLENLEMVGRLYHLPKAEARKRAAEVLERFALDQAANRQAKTYSGGMRRRLDLGASLVGRPQILFMDEPTTGLDPRGRLGLWEIIQEIVSDGTTLLLTTQYMEEADVLADKIAVIDVGKVIAEGTADELKTRVGGGVLHMQVADAATFSAAVGAVGGLRPGLQLDKETGEITIPVGDDGPQVMIDAVRRLDDEKVKLADIALRRPTLDDVFLALTGHATDGGVPRDEEGLEAGAKEKRRRGKRRT